MTETAPMAAPSKAPNALPPVSGLLPMNLPDPARPSERLPLVTKVAFSIRLTTETVGVGLVVNSLWMPFFNIGMGMSPVVLGIILMIFRAWDAITDPVIANYSDNMRTRWGRRKPFMLGGIIALAFIFPVFWYMPAHLSDHGKFLYLCICGLAFFVATTCYLMPYHSLQLELTPNYDERTRVTFWMSVVGKLTTIAIGWVMAFITSNHFSNPHTGKPDIVDGMRFASVFVAAAVLICGLVPVFFVKERFKQKTLAAMGRESLWLSIKESARCRPLWILISIAFLLVVGTAAVGPLFQYSNIYYVFGGDLAAASVLSGWRAVVTSVAGLAAAPALFALAERFDKIKVLTAMLGLMIASHFLNLFLMTPKMPYLQLVSGASEAIAILGVWMLIPSMKADVADYDEQQTTRRREGSLNAFFSWFIKLAITIAVGSSGFLLAGTGFDVTLPTQSTTTLDAMRHAYVFIPIACWMMALVVALRYKLTRDVLSDIRKELEARRGFA